MMSVSQLTSNYGGADSKGRVEGDEVVEAWFTKLVDVIVMKGFNQMLALLASATLLVGRQFTENPNVVHIPHAR